MTASGTWQWARRAPAERLTLPACAMTWAGAGVMHVTGVPALDIAWGTLGTAGLAYGRAARKAKDRRHARHLATGITTVGGWLAVASAAGPAGLPHHALTWTWAAGSLGGYWWLRRHPAVAGARDWREKKTEWLSVLSGRWHLRDTFLLDWKETRLGEWYLIDVKGTGKRASAYPASDLAERVAEAENLPVSRVRIAAHRLAGRIEISVRHRDPWARPVAHPVLAAEPELNLSGPYSITEPAVIGIDPETGDPLPLLLCGPGGGRNITIVAILEWGKTTLLSDISERVTAASDALLIRINLSIKGDSERTLWGPACHLTALGPREVSRAVRVLRAVAGIVEYRAGQPKTTANWKPSARDPHIVIALDEIDTAADVPAFRSLLGQLSSKGREFGVTIVRAGQRGTAEWTGGSNVRAMDGVFILGAVNRSGEAMHAAGEIGLSLPDIASYGEGRKGVWAIAELGGGQHLGRAFDLSEPDDVRVIVAERAWTQPDLPPALRVFLGDSYENLLSTDVFARWARRQGRGPAVTARPRPDASPPPGAQASPVAVLGDSLDALDSEAEEALDDDLRAQWRRTGRKIDGARRELAEAGEAVPDDLPKEALEGAADAEWGKLGAATDIPQADRVRLLDLLKAGTTRAEVARTLGVSPWTSRMYLERLRAEGRVRVEGDRRTARWVLAEPDGGDGS